jgi:hypothetical protein
MRYYVIVEGNAISTSHRPKGKRYRGKEIQAVLTSKEMANKNIRAWLRGTFPRKERNWKPVLMPELYRPVTIND